MLITLAVAGYRSLREVILPLGRLNVVTGPNGSGKSSLYRAIRLLAATAQGNVVGALAAEGGLTSTLWAGPETISRAMKQGDVPVQGTRRKGPVALKLGFAGEDYGYAIDLGLPVPSARTMFGQDPEIKCEALWAGEMPKRSNVFAERKGLVVTLLGGDGKRRVALKSLAPFDSMMTHAADPDGAMELLVVRERMRDWRFYDHFRTDSEAPARRAQVGTRTPVLASDGSDVAAAVQTILEIGDGDVFATAIDDAFPGSSAGVEINGGLFEIVMEQPGLLRPLRAAELSDGTLRFLLLAAALMTPRPPSLMVLNEPETSLHPSLLPALARLITAAARETQVIVVTHAGPLVEALCKSDDTRLFRLAKELGETAIEDVDAPAWAWPKR